MLYTIPYWQWQYRVKANAPQGASDFDPTPTLTSARPPTRVWEVIRTVAAPPSIVVKCGGGGSSCGRLLSCRVLCCCGVVLVVSCVVLFSLCVCVCDLFLFLQTADFVRNVVLADSAAGGGRCHVVGNSVGGLVATHLASREPELIASLLLVNPTVWICMYNIYISIDIDR